MVASCYNPVPGGLETVCTHALQLKGQALGTIYYHKGTRPSLGLNLWSLDLRVSALATVLWADWKAYI